MPLLPFILVAILPLHAEAGEIIGGQEVKPHSWPFMAFVTDSDSTLRKHHCGGFLVAEDIVMTAAHCKRSKLNVILGAHNIKKKENNTEFIPVLKAVSHPDYNKKPYINDIMLLKLKFKANLDGFVKTIALPKSQDWVKPGQLCRVAGWGRLANGKPSDTLQEVTLHVQNEQTCQKMFRIYHKSTQLCVGNPKENKAANMGDSGGPLLCDNVAQGIVSYGHRTELLPVVFTRISSFLPWIKKTMKLLEHP